MFKTITALPPAALGLFLVAYSLFALILSAFYVGYTFNSIYFYAYVTPFVCSVNMTRWTRAFLASVVFVAWISLIGSFVASLRPPENVIGVYGYPASGDFEIFNCILEFLGFGFTFVVMAVWAIEHLFGLYPPEPQPEVVVPPLLRNLAVVGGCILITELVLDIVVWANAECIWQMYNAPFLILFSAICVFVADPARPPLWLSLWFQLGNMFAVVFLGLQVSYVSQHAALWSASSYQDMFYEGLTPTMRELFVYHSRDPHIFAQRSVVRHVLDFCVVVYGLTVGFVVWRRFRK